MFFRYSGRNSFSVAVPEQLKIKSFADYPEHAPYPCRIYDGKGNLKYELSREHLMDKEFKKYLNGYIKSHRVDKRKTV